MQFTAQNPFIYQQPTGAFDWRLFASTDIEGAIATQNVQAMLPLVDNLAFGELDAPVGLQKVFRAQQFMLQYLIYVQTELSNQLNKNDQSDLEAENRRLRAENQKLSQELRQEKQKRASDNMMMRLASLKPELIEAMPRCLECGKAFADYRFLVTHYQKRHPGKPIPPPPIPNYKIEKPEYVLCNCKIDPKPSIPKSKADSPKNSSDIFIENDQINTIIGEKKVQNSLSQTTTFNNSAQSPQIYEETGVLKPQQANFSLNSTVGTTIPLSTGPVQYPKPQQAVPQSVNQQTSQILIDPDGALNSYTNSSGGKETFSCFYPHSKYEQNQAEQNIWNLIGGR